MKEYNYDNCQNLTCRGRCEKEGYNKAIDDFMKIINEISGWTPNCMEHDLSLKVSTLHKIAEELSN